MTPDLCKTDLDHLTAKYPEAAGQIDELQKQLSIQREDPAAWNMPSLENSILQRC